MITKIGEKVQQHLVYVLLVRHDHTRIPSGSSSRLLDGHDEPPPAACLKRSHAANSCWTITSFELQHYLSLIYIPFDWRLSTPSPSGSSASLNRISSRPRISSTLTADPRPAARLRASKSSEKHQRTSLYRPQPSYSRQSNFQSRVDATKACDFNNRNSSSSYNSQTARQRGKPPVDSDLWCKSRLLIQQRRHTIRFHQSYSFQPSFYRQQYAN